jgi:hypothetical protein
MSSSFFLSLVYPGGKGQERRKERKRERERERVEKELVSQLPPGAAAAAVLALWH